MHIKETWKEHPLYKEGKIELVPTDWVWKYWGNDVSRDTRLSDGTWADLETLWQNLLKTGIENPLIMRVGLRNKKFRLEAGNHRIQVLHEHGVQFVPVTVQVREECGPHVKDVINKGSHNFDAPEGFRISTITQEYMKPTEVFKDL